MLHKEFWHKHCVKRFTGLSIKRDVNCWQVLSLVLLFILGSAASHLVLLSYVVIWFVYEEERNPDQTPEETSIVVYKEMLVIELITMAFSIFFTVAFGYMYEIWSRKKVLSISFVLLAVGMALPESGFLEEDSRSYSVGRIVTCVLAQAIMQNPLLMDYVKKQNRGWASAMQFLGKEIGELTAFILIY